MRKQKVRKRLKSPEVLEDQKSQVNTRNQGREESYKNISIQNSEPKNIWRNKKTKSKNTKAGGGIGKEDEEKEG